MENVILQKNLMIKKMIIEVIDEIKNMQEKESLRKDTIIYFRDSFRERFLLLCNNMSFDKNEMFLFPLIAYIDEKMMILSFKLDLKWDILQKELYARNDGGEYVFTMIDQILLDNIIDETSLFIIKIILDNGFSGKYFNNLDDQKFIYYKAKINDILSKIETPKKPFNIFNSLIHISNIKKKLYYVCCIFIVPVSIYVLSLFNLGLS